MNSACSHANEIHAPPAELRDVDPQRTILLLQASAGRQNCDSYFNLILLSILSF